jgi:serine phosphatase RsbU (regulator of sigma subunit)
MDRDRQPSQPVLPRIARKQRWFVLWLVLGAGLAGLLLFDSISTYRFVSRILVINQVRRDLNKRAAQIERELQIKQAQTDAEIDAVLDKLQEEHEKLVWLVLRAPDGHVIAQAGAAPAAPTFSAKEFSSKLRDHEEVLTTKRAGDDELVVELFAVHVRRPHPDGPPPGQPGTSTQDGSVAMNAPPGGGNAAARIPPFPLLEIAMSMKEVNAQFWPIRRNLIIDCTAAIALLISTLIAGLRFRSYVRAQELERQLQLARQVQQALLPTSHKISERVDVSAICVPAWQVGGDFYDTFSVNEDDLALVLGDVSGKGVPAALLAGLVHGAIRSSNWVASPAHHEQALLDLNQLLLERASGERYVTMFSCYYDHAERALHYLNAGHCPPLLVRKTANGFELKQLEEGGTVIGLIAGARYQQATVPIEPGDLLIVFSDGIVESANPRDDEFGEERLAEIVKENFTKGVEEIRARVLRSVEQFASGVPPADDLTLLVVRFEAATASTVKTDAIGAPVSA